MQIHANTDDINVFKPLLQPDMKGYTAKYMLIHADTCKYNLIYLHQIACIWCKYMQVSLSVFSSIASICMYSRLTKVLVVSILANRCNTCKY